MKTGENQIPNDKDLSFMPASSTKFASAIKLIKCGKAQNQDNIPPHIF